MSIKKKNLTLKNDFIKYRTNPKQFQITINKPKVKNLNPLYSTDSLAKYFNLPTSQIKLKVNRTSGHPRMATQSSELKKTFRNNQNIQKFDKMQQTLRLYQQKGTMKIKKKFNILQECHTKVQDHFFKIKNSTNYDDYPRVQIDLDVRLENRYTKIPQKYKKRALSLKSKTQQLRRQIHSQNIKAYLANEDNWIRYGYSLEVQDKEQILRRSIQKRNKSLRRKCSSLQNKSHRLKLNKKTCNNKIFEDSKDYMSTQMKTQEIFL